MFHLINKVYLSFDFAYHGSADNIIISESLSKKIFNNVLEREYGNNIGFKWAKSSSYDELLSFFDNENKLFDWIINFDKNKELIIWCDRNNFDYFLIKWLKTILPNIDEEFAWYAYRISILKFKYIHGYSSLHVDYKNINLRDPWQGLNPMSREVFSKQYNAISPFMYEYDTWKEHVSLEWHIASYLCNSQYVYREMLEARILKMLQRTVISEMIYWKTNIMYLMFELGRMIPNGPKGDYEEATLEEIVSEYPEFSFVLDPEFRGDAIDSIMNKYNMNEIWKLYNISVARFGHNGHPWVERTCELVLNPKENIIDDIIEMDRFTAYAGGNFGEYMYTDKINNYLLRMIYKWANNGELTKVNKLSLVKNEVNNVNPRIESENWANYTPVWNWKMNNALKSGIYVSKDQGDIDG